MKKGISTLILLIAAVFFVSGTILIAADLPGDITIENEGYKKDKKSGVPLSHAKHATEYGAACSDCHHVYEDGNNVWKEGDPVQKCIECHDAQKSQGNAKKLQTAFHKNCKDCHKEKDPSSEKAPSKKCSDCHV